MNEKLDIQEVFEKPVQPLEKFSHPQWTANGEPRASVDPRQLKTLWINTGSACNLTCENCYIESSPSNDRLAYVTTEEVQRLLDEIRDEGFGTQEIGFTGGEPFLNKEMLSILELCLSRGFRTLVLTNGMKTLLREQHAIDRLEEAYPGLLKLRISLDHYLEETHALERGPRSWKPAIACLQWLSNSQIDFAIAGRTMLEEDEASMRTGYAQMFAREGISLNAFNSEQLVLFPEMDGSLDVPEITTACWDILNKNPDEIMCATSRMVVKHKGNEHLSVQACTLLAYDQRFNLGSSLKQAWRSVKLNHPHCAKFCVLGGGSCSS